LPVVYSVIFTPAARAEVIEVRHERSLTVAAL
jgi:hypothetical protein